MLSKGNGVVNWLINYATAKFENCYLLQSVCYLSSISIWPATTRDAVLCRIVRSGICSCG